MGKKLAIKGHLTRGKEVIELFKMMGGCECGYCGGGTGFYYYISQFGNIEASCKPTEFDTYIVYTLEEFWEKYPFKIGDKVIDTADGCPGVVCEMKWDEGLSDMKYFVTFGNGVDFGWYLNDSIEFCEENENLEETQPKRDIDKSDFIIKHMILPNKMDDKLEYEIIDGYEFDKVENNKIILKPIKPKYPTTYEECWKVIFEVDGETTLKEFHHVSGYYSESLGILQKLLCCRDAYWKIAGEQMGLDNLWEPAIQDTIWGITRSKDEIEKYSCHYGKTNLLEFPTEEMRDLFFKNFKELIEQCKELL